MAGRVASSGQGAPDYIAVALEDGMGTLAIELEDELVEANFDGEEAI